LIKKLWAKFDGLDLECVCDEHHKKCDTNTGCKEYVVKFIEVERNLEDDLKEHLDEETRKLRNEINRFQSKISKSIRKFKI